jgi:hypothetical protein
VRLLDLFSGRWGWSRVFAARRWKCLGVDQTESAPPESCELWIWDVLKLTPEFVRRFDFVVASSPCQEFSVHGMPHFHPYPKYPAMGIRLFNHTREICELSGVPYVMENVKPAQWFVGQARARAGSFYLWGNAVPPLMPQGLVKGASQMRRDGRFKRRGGVDELMYMAKDERAAKLATIPPELANCVCDYAEALLRDKVPA